MTPSMSPFDSSPRLPSDLDPSETEMAGWMGHLTRAEAPAALRAHILESLRSVEGMRDAARPQPVAAPAGILSWLRPLAAVAAALLLSLGMIQFGRAAGDAAGTTATSARAPARHVIGDADSSMLVVPDPNLALFHGLESFDSLGAPADELLAAGGG